MLLIKGIELKWGICNLRPSNYSFNHWNCWMCVQWTTNSGRNHHTVKNNDCEGKQSAPYKRVHVAILWPSRVGVFRCFRFFQVPFKDGPRGWPLNGPLNPIYIKGKHTQRRTESDCGPDRSTSTSDRYVEVKAYNQFVWPGQLNSLLARSTH